MSIYKFGNDLTKIRENKRLSQEDLTFLSGLSRRSISRIENRLIKEPSIDTLLKLSATLDLDLVDLYIKNKCEDCKLLPICKGGCYLKHSLNQDECIPEKYFIKDYVRLLYEQEKR